MVDDDIKLPSFIIGGAPRSGTTFLCHALDEHPDIYIAKPFIPEPKVFMRPASSIQAYRDQYRTLFAEAGQRKFLGEKTSYYLESELACRLIRENVPCVKLIFLLREPVSRAYSNYLWSRKNGLETLDFREAIALEGKRSSPLPSDKSYAKPFDYLSRGDYASFAQRYYDSFGKDRVAFFLYEDIERDPERLFTEIQRFVGVEPLPFARLNVGVVNSARDLGPLLDPDFERQLRERMQPFVSRFQSITGLDVSPWGYSNRT